MIFVWNRQHGSDRAQLLVLSSLFAVLLLAQLPGAGWAQEASLPAKLDFVSGLQASTRMRDWLEADRAWLRESSTSGIPDLPVQPKSVSADSIRTMMMSRFNGAAGDTLPPVRPLAARLRDRWLDRGFFEASVTRSDPVSLPVFLLDPGPVYRFAGIEILGNDFPGRGRLLDIWLPAEDTPLDAARFNEGVKRILEGAGEAGFPFARWVTSKLDIDRNKHLVSIKASLLPGKRSYIGPITSNLSRPRAARFLSRASGLSSGQLFRESDLRGAVQKLLARDLYAGVDIPRVYPTTSVDTVGIHFQVRPRRKVNRLQVVLGLSRKQDSGPSRLSGEVDLRLPNLAGSGRNLGINWRDDGSTRSRLGFDYLEPMIFGTPLDMFLALDSEVEEESFNRFRLDNRWQLPVVALWGVELGLGWDRATYPQGSLESSSRTRARAAFLHRRGDRSRSGWTATFALETARRSSVFRPDEASGPVSSQLGQDTTQRIYEVDAGGEVWLGRTWSLAAGASFRQVTGSEKIFPLAEQFRFGGAATLRGYREDEFHGSEAAWATLELRIGPPRGSRLYTFYDLGYFGFSTQAAGVDTGDETVWNSSWPRGYGLGLLARTTGGDLSLAIGFPGTVDFDVAKLHVTLLESF